jgi:hypothetical protein
LKRLTALLGNGVSVAYNAQLAVPQLTSGIVARFNALAGTTVEDALRAAAQRVSGTSRDDFEALLGPLDATTEALAALRQLSPLASRTASVELAVKRVTRFVADIHRVGLAEVLGLIAERASGQGEAAFDAVPARIARELMALPAPSPITVANLSYDGLINAGLLREMVSMADLASGIHPVTVDVGAGWPLSAHELREDDDLPPSRVHLLHLHGSLGWLRTSDGTFVKCALDDLRVAAYWRRYANKETKVSPVVVLTDRKTPAVEAEPFALAYRIFGERLAGSDHWLIAGYSFLDVPVNQAFRQALRLRRDLGKTPPNILVIGQGAPSSIRSTAQRALGKGIKMRVTGAGVPTIFDRAFWKEWAQ